VDEKRLVRDFPARWMGRVMRGDTVLKDIFEGRIKRKQQTGRPRCKTLEYYLLLFFSYAFHEP